MVGIPWYLFGLLSAFLTATTTTLQKSAFKRITPTAFLAIANTIGFICLLPFAANEGLPALGGMDILSAATLAVIMVLAWILSAEGLRLGDIGTSSAFFLLEPLLVAVLSWAALGEVLSPIQILAIIMIVAGLLLAERNPLRGIANRSTSPVAARSLLFSLAGAVIFAFSSVLERFLLGYQHLSPQTVLVLYYGFSLVILWPLVIIRRQHTLLIELVRRPGSRSVMFTVVIALLMLASRYSFAQTSSMADAALASALKHVSPVIAMIMGAVFFHERNLPERLGGAAIILLGTIILIGS
jgi:drug/metabolite transporter (DMT)-like permease